MLRTLTGLTGLLILSTTSAESFALETDEIFVTGLRPASLDDTPASITVLDADALSIRNTPYIADQLRAVPGIGVSRSGPQGGLTQVRVRGAEANHTLVLLDGIEISDPVTGETDFGLWSSLNIARLEILRGEQSTIYGSDAIGGVINIVSDIEPGTRFAAEAGSNNTVRATGRHYLETRTLGLSLAGSSFQTDGVDTSGTGGATDGSKADTAMLNGRLTLGENWIAKGLIRISQDEVDTDADTDFNGVLEDTDTQTISNQMTSGITISGSTGSLDHQINTAYTRVERKNESSGIRDDKTTGKRTTLSYSPSWQVQRQQHNLTVSALLDFEREEYERKSSNTFFGDPNQQQTFDTLGTAVEIVAQAQNWTFQASARHDDNDGRFDNASTWRAGLAYNVSDQTRLRTSAGQGVKNPTFTELFGFFPASFLANPTLKPEKSTSYEVGLDHEVGPAQFSLVWFEAELEDEIFTAFNPDFTSIARNREGQSTRNGIEASVNWPMSERLNMNATYTNISSKNDQNQDDIRVPEQTASLNLDWQPAFLEGLKVGSAADYVGEQNDIFFSFPQQDVKLEAYTLISATASYPLNENLSLTFRGQNILDKQIEDVTGFRQPGSQFFIGLRLN
ncbi:MAG: TonB-dependent receptor [Aquisalinus sp.]|nr:TonB-dependent receptor [Aquisalinus sp.]